MNQENRILRFSIVNIAIILLTIILANRRVLLIQAYYLHSAFDPLPYIREIICWVFVLVMVAWILTKQGEWNRYLHTWKENIPLLGFLLLSVCSLAWSIYPQASILRISVLLCSTIVATYIGFYFPKNDLMNILTWCGGGIAILSLLGGVFFSEITIENSNLYNNAWRGIFWHRNQLGSLMAFFSVVFLVRIVTEFEAKEKSKYLLFFIYPLTIALVFLSRSFTGTILLVFLHLCVILIAFWLKWRDRIKPIHFILTALGSMIALAFIIRWSDFIFDLVNRSSSWTGRLNLWRYLWFQKISESPLKGFGYGAIWSNHEFRVKTGEIVEWGIPILMADNGYLDIFLNIGVLGFLSFIFVLLIVVYRAFRYGVSNNKLASYFPLILMGYVFFANSTFSLFLELESFVWMIVVAMLVALSPTRNGKLKKIAKKNC